MLRKRVSVLACLVLALSGITQNPASAADTSLVSKVFSQLASIPTLADPSVIVLDEKSGEVIFESSANSPRKPASVIKLVSAAAAYTYLTPTDSFTTSLWSGVDSKSVVIQGSLDPWISYDHKVAVKMSRTSLERIEYNALSTIKEVNSGSTKQTTIYYSNLYAQDVAHIEKFLKTRDSSISLKRVTQKQASTLSGEYILGSTSPTLEKIIDWTLVWSDNLLAERIARLASVAAGNSFDDAGVAKTFTHLLTEMGINTANLVVKDASGLSKQNRMTARQVSQLLMVIYHDPKFAPLVEGLPVGGVSGTLQNRFLDTAPEAVGLVRAKTGTLNGTTNLAGFVESGDHNYIFVVIADRHSKSYTVTKKVRATVDRILGKIATPLLPVLLPITPVSDSATVTN
jgi:D-alanyl-D-alanine carboxypeptidase/D-alanyl-D-alanine-endopeptidase (penicillin-binding protein 4)